MSVQKKSMCKITAVDGEGFGSRWTFLNQNQKLNHEFYWSSNLKAKKGVIAHAASIHRLLARILRTILVDPGLDQNKSSETRVIGKRL